jgi:SAM-dependent methyltransferase
MDADILAHYGQGVERDRLGPDDQHPRLELVRTQELLRRHLPPPPARVVDVGGGPGVHARWLAADGYDVHLLDVVPLHVEQARAAGISADEGDARSLPFEDASADVVLLLGPLYHLTERADRIRALAEARRVVTPDGVIAVAAVNRFASLLDGFVSAHHDDPDFAPIVERDLRDGQHRNPGDHPGWFTTAYFHHPDELRAELQTAGLDVVLLAGVEGPAWLFEGQWLSTPERREVALRAARALEEEPALLGLSAHLLAIART